jgi:hypothetical protein
MSLRASGMIVTVVVSVSSAWAAAPGSQLQMEKLRTAAVRRAARHPVVKEVLKLGETLRLEADGAGEGKHAAIVVRRGSMTIEPAELPQGIVRLPAVSLSRFSRTSLELSKYTDGEFDRMKPERLADKLIASAYVAQKALDPNRVMTDVFRAGLRRALRHPAVGEAMRRNEPLAGLVVDDGMGQGGRVRFLVHYGELTFEHTYLPGGGTAVMPTASLKLGASSTLPFSQLLNASDQANLSAENIEKSLLKSARERVGHD